MQWIWICVMGWLCLACSGSARDDAALATNTAQSVLIAVDEVWSPIVQEQIAAAKAYDDAEYKRRMAPYLTIQEALEKARVATQLLNLAVQVWDAQHDDGAMFADLAPCVVQDLELVRALLSANNLAPPELLRAIAVIQGALSGAISSGAVCKHSLKPVATEAASMPAPPPGPPPEPAPPIPTAPAAAGAVP